MRFDTMPFDTLLTDIDGTLVHKGEALPGAPEALRQLRDAGLKLRLLTNTTAKQPAALAADLRHVGFDVADDEIETASTACVSYLAQQPGKSCHLIVPGGVRDLFNDVMINDSEPDIVVIGDIGEDFDYRTLNRAFRMLRAGAELVALQKNLFWIDRDGERLDCGAFIVGLETAAKVTARVTGKPSRTFFDAALRQLDAHPETTLVVGDDILTDITGARAIGAQGVLVKTGKFEHAAFERYLASLDHIDGSPTDKPRRDAICPVIDSFTDLPQWIDQYKR